MRRLIPVTIALALVASRTDAADFEARFLGHDAAQPLSGYSWVEPHAAWFEIDLRAIGVVRSSSRIAWPVIAFSSDDLNRGASFGAACKFVKSCHELNAQQRALQVRIGLAANELVPYVTASFSNWESSGSTPIAARNSWTIGAGIERALLKN